MNSLYAKFVKPACDLLLSLIALAALSPLLAYAAARIRLESPGPVFFRQKRCGRGGKYFTMLKFRSMAVDNHAESKGFEPGSASRITPFGKTLRRTKIDELPQLINVVRGDMSIVGPRPEVQRCIEYYPEKWETTLSVKPGITDPASVKFRNEEDLLAAAPDPEKAYRDEILPQKIAIYDDYARNISIAGDAKIILDTIFTVLFK